VHVRYGEGSTGSIGTITRGWVPVHLADEVCHIHETLGCLIGRTGLPHSSEVSLGLFDVSGFGITVPWHRLERGATASRDGIRLHRLEDPWNPSNYRTLNAEARATEISNMFAVV
jgi:hypothetical protein